jgi:serine/threonine-protein kinase
MHQLTALTSVAPHDDLKLAASIALRRADLEMRLGDARAALPVVQEAASLSDRASSDSGRVQAMILLVLVLDELGRTTESGALMPLLEAAATRETLDDKLRSELENALGTAAQSAGNYADAERHHRAALAAVERTYAGIPSPVTAGVLADIAMSLHSQAKVDEARDFATRSATMFERTVGPDHPDIAYPLGELAVLALEDDRLDEAAELFERMIAVRSAALGPDHPYLSEPISFLGRVELDRGHVDRALELQRRALALAEHGFGEGHPLVAVAQLRIAQILVTRNELAEARRLAEASVKIWDASGTVTPDAYDARFLLAKLIWDRDHVRARALAEVARVHYAGEPPPYNKEADSIASWLAAHR